MDIDEMLKQQAAWAEKMKELTMSIMKRRTGITPDEAGLGEMGGAGERIKALETRRDAMLRAFETAIAMERRSEESAPKSGGPHPESKPVRAVAKRARAATKSRK